MVLLWLFKDPLPLDHLHIGRVNKLLYAFLLLHLKTGLKYFDILIFHLLESHTVSFFVENLAVGVEDHVVYFCLVDTHVVLAGVFLNIYYSHISAVFIVARVAFFRLLLELANELVVEEAG